MDEHQAWLNSTIEETIDPTLPICDPHHHFFDVPADVSSSMPGAVPSHYLLDELFSDLSAGHNITETVVVESAIGTTNAAQRTDPASQTARVEALVSSTDQLPARQTRVAAGIVQFADLTLGNAVPSVLEAHLAASQRFRGVRQITTWDPSPRIHSTGPPKVLTHPEFRKGFAYLDRYGLSFDALVYHTQLTDVFDLAMKFPNTAIVLEHTGCPLGSDIYAGRRRDVFDDWRAAIETLATCSNIFVKLGGLAMPVCGFGWNLQPVAPSSEELAEKMRPYYLWCIDRFGVERCMFESNFPVEKQSCSYNVLWNAFKRIASGFSSSEKGKLFRDTACSVYRLSRNNGHYPRN
jgi:L-fuconolactonase